MDGMDEKASEIDMFCEVFQLNKDFIFGDATYALNRNRQENLRKPEALPLEADLKKAFTVDTISSMLSDCYKVWDSHAFKELRDLTVSRLTLFNARSSGEPSRLRISEWVDADNNSWISEDQIDKLDPIGKALVHTLKVAYQSGKGNNHLVPVLFPKDCLVSMRKLTDKVCRRQCGISEENSYVLAATSKSLNHVSGWHAVAAVCEASGVGNKQNITATKNRHRISTLYACMDVPEAERTHFCKHMGHSADINHNIYQAPLAVQEVTKIGRSLLEIDQGII